MTAQASYGACSEARACRGESRSAAVPPPSRPARSRRSRRLRLGSLRPGDLLFFGTATFGSTATESNVTHEGIYLGDNWVINASSQGVYVEPLAGGWLGDSFAWGRRVIS